jgi:large subunit ribosomal protein L29
MAIIRKNELVQMDEKTLNEKLTELKMELIKINAQISMGTLPENPGRIKEIRKTIARIKTLKNMREDGK